jgi:hypothetical protein
MIADSREPGMLSEAWLKANTVGDCLIGQEELVHQNLALGKRAIAVTWANEKVAGDDKTDRTRDGSKQRNRKGNLETAFKQGSSSPDGRS